MDARRSPRQFRDLDAGPRAGPRPSRHPSRELHEVYARLREAGGDIVAQGQTACCYAKSEKSWIDDPAGIAWETFHTTGESTVYGDGTGENGARIAQEKASACCVPEIAGKPATACCNG
jgi:hypothetical protein